MADPTGIFGTLFVRAAIEPAGLVSARESMRESSPKQTFEVKTFEEASKMLAGLWRGVVFLILNSKPDLIHIIELLQAHRHAIKTEKTVRIVIFSSLNNSQVSTFLMKNGVTEVLDFDTPSRAISHKASVHLKLSEQARHQPSATAVDFDKVLKGDKPFSAAELLHIGKTDEGPEPANQEAFVTGVAALQARGAQSTWNGILVELLDQTSKGEITVDVPKIGWSVGEPFTLEFETKNLGLKPHIKLNGKVQELCPHEMADRDTLKIQLDLAATADLEKIQSKMDAIQDEVLQFMKEAKG